MKELGKDKLPDYERAVTCLDCGKDTTIHLTYESWRRWKDGALAQDCFDYLTPAQREILISGMCSVCWNDMVEKTTTSDCECDSEHKGCCGNKECQGCDCHETN